MSHRSSMTASVIRTIVAAAARAIPPDIAEVVSVTEVEVSVDMGNATIYISAFKNPREAARYLRTHKGEIKKQLGNALQSFRVPTLQFRTDERGEKLNRLDMLLDGKNPDNIEKTM